MFPQRSFWQENSPIGFIFGLGAAMGFVVGLVVVYQILYADVSDHLGEYATLKAMGYSNFFLSRVVVYQAIILADEFLDRFPRVILPLVRVELLRLRKLFRCLHHLTRKKVQMAENGMGLSRLMRCTYPAWSGGYFACEGKYLFPVDWACPQISLGQGQLDVDVFRVLFLEFGNIHLPSLNNL